MVDDQLTLEWRHRTARASGALADAAGNSDRIVGGAVAEVHVVRIDEGVGVGDFTAERQGVTGMGGAVAAAAFGGLGRKTEIAHAIRRLRKLADDPAGRLEGLVHVPERTGRTETGELQLGGAVALGDVAGPVDPREEDRNAFLPRPLQRRKPMTDLLQRGTETGCKKLHVVAQIARGFQERLVGQDQRAGEIVLQADSTDLIGFLGAEAGASRDTVDLLAGVHGRSAMRAGSRASPPARKD